MQTEFKEAIKLAAKLHEQSWSIDVGITGGYAVNLTDAVKTACSKYNISGMERPIEMLLHSCWNDVLEWSK